MSGSILGPQWAHLRAPKRKRVSTLVNTRPVPLHREGRTRRRGLPATWTVSTCPELPKGGPWPAGARPRDSVSHAGCCGARFAHGTETSSTRTCGFLGGQAPVLADDWRELKAGYLKVPFLLRFQFSFALLLHARLAPAHRPWAARPAPAGRPLAAWCCEDSPAGSGAKRRCLGCCLVSEGWEWTRFILGRVVLSSEVRLFPPYLATL